MRTSPFTALQPLISFASGPRPLGRRALLVTLGALLAGAPGIPAETLPLQLENEHLRVEWAKETGRILVWTAGDLEHWVAALSVAGAETSGRIETQSGMGPLGWERRLVIRQPDGRGAVLSLPGEEPFLLVRSLLRAPEDAVGRWSLVPVVSSARVHFERPLKRLKALGTGGLKAIGEAPGSYVFLALADPESRSGLMAAWLTHQRGCGVLFPSTVEGQAAFQARVEYGRLQAPPGETVESEILALGWFADVREGLERYAEAVARAEHIVLPPQLEGYCTWYSRPHGGASDARHLVELARFAARELKPFGLDFIQIDDGWQEGRRRNGPAKIFTSHRPAGPYPDGIAPVARQLRALGLITGLWWMPFAGDRQDPFFADKHQWFVQRPDGTPYWTRWGGSSLDLTRPEVRHYVATLADRIAHDWGCRYFKLDRLWTGLAAQLLYVHNAYRQDDFGQAVFHDPAITPIEAYRQGLRLIRQAAGRDVFLLGCNVSQNMRSFGASFGLLDAMRIGPDNGPSFKGLTRGPWHGANRWFLHRRVWYNDPDPVYVRASMPLEHARLICSWVGVAGFLTVASDWLPGLPPERLELLKRILPAHQGFARPVDILERDLPAIWHLPWDTGDQHRDILGFFNWNEKEPLTIVETAERLGLPAAPRYETFDFWADTLLPAWSDRLELTLPPGNCRVLAIRPAADHPQVLSTSRHVTQGVIDLLEETWDPAHDRLQGRSALVRGDPYELRIVLPESTSWKVSQATLDATPEFIKWTCRQKGRLVRLRWTRPRTEEVAWSVTFLQQSARKP